MGQSVLTAEAIRQAAAECDRLGRDDFLRKYGYGRARDYFLILNGKDYDCRAILGVAYGYLPDKQPLHRKEFPIGRGANPAPISWEEFSGGEETCEDLLKKLGFEVRRV